MAQEWRLKAKLDVHEPARALDGVLGRFRGPDVVKDVQSAVGKDAVITHDGSLLFAYAPSQQAIDAIRAEIESALASDQITADVVVGVWDNERDRWRQVEPPLSARQGQVEAAAARADEAVETRTLVATAGRIVRADFETAMLDGAQALGLECTVVEHPHLLSTQVAFTVTGPKRKIDEFASGLRAEGAGMTRADALLQASPL